MEPVPILESPAPAKGTRTIKIDGVEYAYSINQVQEEEKLVVITLSEEKPDKNITFTYKASEKKLIKDIKLLSACDNVEEIILELTDIFNNEEILVEKKEEKYFMKIITSKRALKKESVFLLFLIPKTISKPFIYSSRNFSSLERTFAILV